MFHTTLTLYILMVIDINPETCLNECLSKYR